MKTSTVLERADVDRIVAAAQAEAQRHDWAVTIAVVDPGGHPWTVHRLDGAAPLSAHIAPSKARTAALARRETKALEDQINQGRTAYVTAPAIDGVLEGGVPILKDGQCVGAVGVSGALPAQDVQIARAGIAALGL
ncbi:heme-binding protein [Streptomyces sp. NPDC048290]|uniref:GlcG/HbpS family heme-binding protein n=1 Tax=Streptomyces sp. NPDC048290 TaxID=3155811 RepID=UPI00343D18AC